MGKIKWIDASEEKSSLMTMSRINFVARDVGVWDEVRVCRLSIAADSTWTIYTKLGDLWRQSPIEFHSRDEAMAVAEQVSSNLKIRAMTAAAELMETVAHRARLKAFAEAARSIQKRP